MAFQYVTRLPQIAIETDPPTLPESIDGPPHRVEGPLLAHPGMPLHVSALGSRPSS